LASLYLHLFEYLRPLFVLSVDMVALSFVKESAQRKLRPDFLALDRLQENRAGGKHKAAGAGAPQGSGPRVRGWVWRQVPTWRTMAMPPFRRCGGASGCCVALSRGGLVRPFAISIAVI
jgi:hypothetical protein